MTLSETPTYELLSSPVFDNNLGKEILIGLSNSGELSQLNICELTDHTRLIFVHRSELPEQPVEYDKDKDFYNFFVPEDVRPRELCSIIENLYAENPADAMEVRKVICERLYGSVEHLGQIIEIAEQRLPEQFVDSINPLREMYNATSDFLIGMDIPLEEITSSSLIGFSPQEVHERIERLVDSIGKNGDDRLLKRYVSMIMHVAHTDLRGEIQNRLKGETAMALYTRGNNYLVENLPVSSHFEDMSKNKEKEAIEQMNIFRRFLRQFDRHVQLVDPASANTEHRLILDKLKEQFSRFGAGKKPEKPEEQVMLLQTMMAEINNFDGWLSNFWTDISRTAPSKVVELGEMGCISRTALSYGLLRRFGWEKDELYTLDVEGHAALIVKTDDGDYLLEFRPSGRKQKGRTATFELIKLKEFDRFSEDLDSRPNSSRIDINFGDLLSDVDTEGNYQHLFERQCSIHKADRALGFMFLNHLAIVYGNSGRSDLRRETLIQVLAADPNNTVAKNQLERLEKETENFERAKRNFESDVEFEANLLEPTFEAAVRVFASAYFFDSLRSNEDYLDNMLDAMRTLALYDEEETFLGYKNVDQLLTINEIEAALYVFKILSKYSYTKRNPKDYDKIIRMIETRRSRGI